MMQWILTHQNIRFDLDKPKPEMIDPEDIAHALANICRFTGHTNRYYSVAEHCVHCSFLVEPKLMLNALLHDAAEAYYGDINSPLKAMIPWVKTLERRALHAIAERFGVGYQFEHDGVVLADELMLHREAIELMPLNNWADKRKAKKTESKVSLRCWDPERAKRMFLSRLEMLLELEPAKGASCQVEA